MTDAPRSYTVVGAGAVGLLYGGRLAEAGHRVRWLVRTGADEIRERGIRIDSAEGSTVLRPEPGDVAEDPGELSPSDVVLVALKTTANHRLAELVGPLCRGDTTVALFQNGLGAESAVRDTVPGVGPIAAGLCFVCAHRVGPGHVDHLDYGAVTLAQLDTHGAEGGAAVAIADDLVGAGVEASVLPDLAVARWRKLVWNIPFNGLCTLLDTDTDRLLADAGTRRLVIELMDEVIDASKAVGAPVEAGFRDEMVATTEAMRPYEPSMMLDRRAGRSLEVDSIYDVAVEAARAAGAPMVRVETLAAMLHHIDPARSSGS